MILDTLSIGNFSLASIAKNGGEVPFSLELLQLSTGLWRLQRFLELFRAKEAWLTPFILASHANPLDCKLVIFFLLRQSFSV